MILTLFPPSVFGLLDRDHTYRGTRRTFLPNFQGEASPLENVMNSLETDTMSRVRGECFL